MKKWIRFTVDGMLSYCATLQEYPLAEKISGLCPFTAEFTRSGEHEYYAMLPQKVIAGDCPPTTTGHRNGLYYFEGWNALSLVFHDCDTAPYKIHHIGDFEDDMAAVIENMGRSIHISCNVEGGT